MSGHNKWSKIKHKKAATDALKSKLFSKHAAIIAMESRKAQGNLTSPSLLAVIERAKKDAMPKANIDRAVAKGAGAGNAAYEEVIFEAFGPGGVGMIITAVTDNNFRTTPEIRSLFTKAGLNLGAPGSALWAFTKTINGYVPNNSTTLSDKDSEGLKALMEKLSDHEDVQEIYTTADTTDRDTTD